MTFRYQSGFSLRRAGDLPYLTCGALGVPNAFSTRLGGISEGEGLDSLDLGMGAAEDVAENRGRFLAVLGAEPTSLFSAKQIHSPQIETVGAKDLGRAFVCDGFVTGETGLTLSVKTADCVPILLSDRCAGVIAAVHAGWRGTVAGVVISALESMKALGAHPENTVAAIGPSIRACCYEVDLPFVAAVEASPYADLTCPLVTERGGQGAFSADLVGMNLALLRASGVPTDGIFVSGFCTACASKLFYSHRASGGKRGLLMAVIRR